MSAGHALRRSLDHCYAAAAWLAAGCVFAILVLMIGASVGRVVGWRVGGVNDIVAWLCAGAAFLAMAYAFKNGDFVRVTLVLDKWSPPIRRVFELVSLSIAMFAVGYLAYWAATFTWESYEFNDMASGMVAIPIWIPQLSFVVGAGLFWIAVVDEWFLVVRGHQPTYVRLVAERHAQGDFSADL